MTTKKTYNWAVLGCGKIAKKFASDLKLLENANLYATASRSLQKAEEFSNEFGFEKAYGTYEEMVNDPKVDIVYIATPHSLHLEHSLLCMNHKKAVLCEKAFAINEKEVSQMIASSKENNTFLMEAFWTRFNPAFLKVLEIIQSNELGALKHVKCDFKFFAPFNPEHRLFNMDLGGGSLLDIGIYPVFTALMTLGLPNEIQVEAELAKTGADENIEMLFKYTNGNSANLASGLKCNAFNASEFLFEHGAVRIFRELDQPLLYKKGYELTSINIENSPGLGYQLEAKHVMECLDKNLLESPMLPLSFSLDLIKTLDRIRKKANIVYPNHDKQ
ncbi:Gfo/Idh/MocA family protein [Flavicella sediminum]|uniref:Gfo/Idh/MocA family protein n=1 Tax=Flavicella sediminum TaxID=2585141 RepID=UPI001124BFDD|nr:Gfo/Idh/MocA family oxidoreductase [Flavicella sediminum]